MMSSNFMTRNLLIYRNGWGYRVDTKTEEARPPMLTIPFSWIPVGGTICAMLIAGWTMLGAPIQTMRDGTRDIQAAVTRIEPIINRLETTAIQHENRLNTLETGAIAREKSIAEIREADKRRDEVLSEIRTTLTEVRAELRLKGR